MAPVVTQPKSVLKVMHVLAPARFGGLERVVTSLATGQHSQGSCVCVVLFLSDDGAGSNVGRELRTAGITVYEIVTGDRNYLRKLSVLRAHVSRVEPDIIHTHGYVADVFGALLNRSRGTFRIVSTVHGFTGGNWKNRVYERLQRGAFRRFDAVIGVSRPITKLLIDSGCDVDRVFTITNAWNGTEPPMDAQSARIALGVEDSAFSVGWVGRVSHEKGLDVLVNALPALSDLRVRLTVIGDGSEKATVQRRADQIGVASRIRWAGVVDGAARLLRAFDVVVISSRTEGTPIILLEAIDAGVPVLASAVGGIPDIVTSEEALLVQPGEPAALANGLRLVYSDPQGAASRAAAARTKAAAQFAVEPWVGAYSKVYAAAAQSPAHHIDLRRTSRQP